MKDLKIAPAWLVVACLALLLATFQACSKKPGVSGKLFTPITLSWLDMLAQANATGMAPVVPLWQAQDYAQVDEAQLAAFGDRYRQRLFDKGIPINANGGSGWDKRFNCVLFAESYVADLGAELFAEKFQDKTTAVRPAAFVIFYKPSWAPLLADGTHEGHAIVLLITSAGPRFIEPQSTVGSGKVTLTPVELATVYHRRA